MGVTDIVLELLDKHLKGKLRVFLTGYTVAMVARDAKKIPQHIHQSLGIYLTPLL